MENLMYGEKIEINNVFSKRKKLLQTEIQNEIKKINELITKNSLGKIRRMITAAHSAENVNDQIIVDTEMMFEIEGDIKKMKVLTDVYNFTKKDFWLHDTVYAKHEGDVSNLMNTVEIMMEFIRNNKIMQITNLYTVYSENESSFGSQSIQCYIGTSKNRL